MCVWVGVHSAFNRLEEDEKENLLFSHNNEDETIQVRGSTHKQIYQKKEKHENKYEPETNRQILWEREKDYAQVENL